MLERHDITSRAEQTPQIAQYNGDTLITDLLLKSDWKSGTF
jgi:hypothetical protein